MIRRTNPAAPGKVYMSVAKSLISNFFLTLVYTFLERARYIAGLLGLLR